MSVVVLVSSLPTLLSFEYVAGTAARRNWKNMAAWWWVALACALQCAQLPLRMRLHRRLVFNAAGLPRANVVARLLDLIDSAEWRLNKHIGTFGSALLLSGGFLTTLERVLSGAADANLSAAVVTSLLALAGRGAFAFVWYLHNFVGNGVPGLPRNARGATEAEIQSCVLFYEWKTPGEGEDQQERRGGDAVSSSIILAGEASLEASAATTPRAVCVPAVSVGCVPPPPPPFLRGEPAPQATADAAADAAAVDLTELEGDATTSPSASVSDVSADVTAATPFLRRRRGPSRSMFIDTGAAVVVGAAASGPSVWRADEAGHHSAPSSVYDCGSGGHHYHNHHLPAIGAPVVICSSGAGLDADGAVQGTACGSAGCGGGTENTTDVRSSGDVSSGDDDDVSSTVATPGSSRPVRPSSSATTTSTTPGGTSSSCSAPMCAVCLSDFEHLDAVAQMPCSPLHVFHAGCVVPWLRQQKSCPLCVQDVTEPYEPSPRGGQEEEEGGTQALL